MLTGHYQNGYVTRDLDAALDILAVRFGIDDLSRYDAEVTVQTPTGDQAVAMRIAAGWTGDINIEVLQPVGGYTQHLTSMLPPEDGTPSLHFHHVGLRRNDLPAMREEMATCGYPVVMAGAPPGLAFAYLDARASLGHYIELGWKEQGGWEKIGWPEGKFAG